MFWKVYLGFLIILSLPTYLWQGFSRIWEIIDIIVLAVAITGLIAFSWGKKLLAQRFWKVFLLVFMVWNMLYQYFLPVLQKVSEVDIGRLSRPMIATIVWIPFIPLAIALYLYAFKRNELWEK